MSRTHGWICFPPQSHWTSLQSVTLYLVLTRISMCPVLCHPEVFRTGQFIYRLIRFFGTSQNEAPELIWKRGKWKWGQCEIRMRKKTKDREKKSDKEETREGGSFSPQSIMRPLMYECAMKIDFQVNYSRLSAFYKTITFTKVPLSWVRWVHLFISLRIFCLSSFLPLTFHSLTELLKRPSNYRQTVLIDSGGNYTGVKGGLWNMRSIWLWDGGKGVPIFSENELLRAGGRLSVRSTYWSAHLASRQVRDAPRWSPSWLSSGWNAGASSLSNSAWYFDLAMVNLSPEMCRCVCALSRLHVGMLWVFWLQPLVLPHFL